MTALPPPPVIPERWLRLEPKRDPHDPDTGVLDAVAKAIRAEIAKHPADATCACPTIKAIEKLAEFGYELVSVDDLALALQPHGDDRADAKVTAEQLLARIVRP